VLHALSIWAKRRSTSSQYSKAYSKLRRNGVFNSRGMLMGSDIEEAIKLEFLRSRYEKLNSQSGCWTCSPIIIVVSPPAKDPERAYAEQRKRVEAVKASFSSSYGVKLEEVGRLNLGEVARNIISRRITGSHKLHLASDELSLFVNLPKPITPSISYTPRKAVEFEAFDPAELRRNGIFLGYYESMGKRLEVRIGIDDLPLHLAIFGIPGSGKTTLVKSLIRRYEELGGVSMIFDRHGEYVGEFNEALEFNPESIKINLLEHGGNPETHAKTLSEVFAMAWPDEFSPLLSHIFRRMYLRYIRKPDNPSLTGFIAFLEDENNPSSENWMLLRSGKARDKLFSLVGRLSELTEGNMGKIFDSRDGDEVHVEKLLSKTVVFDLTGLDTDRDANIFTWLMLKKVYDYRRRKPNDGLPHVMVCEEAHNIAPAKFEGQEIIVEKMLREMRKFGESIWLIDQRPLTVSRDVLGLCGTMICFRLQYSSDVKKIADTMHLNNEQTLKLQELKQGEAIILLPRMNTAIPTMIRNNSFLV